MGQPPFVIKVCGVTNREDAQAAVDAGANALGFNFYARSPRFVSVDQAADIISTLKGEFLRVGVFVNPAENQIAPLQSLLDVAQIHGVGHASLPTWRAIAAGTVPPPDNHVDAWLLDAPTPHFGGSGRPFDWSLAAAFPYRAIVAGGLDSHNVSEAIRIAQPWGVDSCSRLEAVPGRKDHRRVQAFVEHALEAFRAIQTVNI